MKYILGFLLSCLLWASPAAAQEISRYVKVGGAPTWVVPHDAPTDIPSSDRARDDYYPMVDWQYRITRSKRDFYGRFVRTLASVRGVENNSTITINFDPNYQTVTLHHLHVIRAGQIIDRLDVEEFDIYRVETDREKLIFNGDLQLAYIVPDVRPGDTIDYAYTRHGKNPATGPHFSLRFQQQYDDITLAMHTSALIHKDVPVYTTAIEGAVEPTLTQQGDYTFYAWDFVDNVPVTADSGRPDWHYGWASYHMSSYESWADVGAYFSKHYVVPKPLPANVAAWVADIRTAHDTPETRLRAALARIQSEVRYLGIELGAGGYIPRSPERVLDRRYGDCKDMTFLLVSLLSGLDIKAVPFLVDSDMKGGVELWQPTHTAFDHIVVRAEIGDQVYILDPTRGEQLGTIETLQQGQFEKGVVVAPGSAGLVDASVPMPEYFEEFREAFDMLSDPDDITLELTATYRMHRGDSMLSWYQRNGKDYAEKSFLEFYQGHFPTIEQNGDMILNIDEDGGAVTFVVSYIIPDAWGVNSAESRKEFQVLVREIDSEIPEFDGAVRKHPYKMSHPVRTQETLVFNLDETWNLSEENVNIENDAFVYDKKARFDAGVYTETYSYISKSDHIAAMDFKDVMSEIDTIEDGMGVTLFTGTEEASSDEDLLYGIGAIVFFLWLIGALIALGVFIGRKY